jgi:hypothetical protein
VRSITFFGVVKSRKIRWAWHDFAVANQKCIKKIGLKYLKKGDNFVHVSLNDRILEK